MIDVTAQQQRFTLINIYGPNSDSRSFFKRIIQHLEEIGNSHYIICGDFNLVLDPYIDCSKDLGQFPIQSAQILTACG